jgi:hypothetical protein
MSDGLLASSLGISHQTVNQICRALQKTGYVRRYRGSEGLTLSAVVDAAHGVPLTTVMPEDLVKTAVAKHLEALGYKVKLIMGKAPGIDIDARRVDERLVLEAKGEAALNAQQVNYVLGALGELLQRMDDPAARYGLALPDNAQYRKLISGLPTLMRERLKFVAFFVGIDGNVRKA